MKKIDLPKSVVIEYYNNGESCYKIATRFNCSPKTIHNFLTKNGIDTNRRPNFYRKNQFNERYFETIDTEDKAYFLGLIYSDGCLYKNILSISLVQDDSYILDTLKTYIGSTTNLYSLPPRKKSHQPQMKFSVSSEMIKKDLERLGVTPKKSLTLNFPNNQQVPFNLLNHFIRGVFDGDGSIFSYERIINKKKYTEIGITIISSNSFILGLFNYLGYGNVYSTNHNKNSVLSFNNKKDKKKFIEFLYKDSTIFLKRKKEKSEVIFDYLNKKNYFYSGEKICQMDLNFNVIKVWDNISQIKKETNFNTQTILRNIKGKIKTSNNHIFKIYD
jgi:intein-encoded DNA endonuclease-like protein